MVFSISVISSIGWVMALTTEQVQREPGACDDVKINQEMQNKISNMRSDVIYIS